MALPGLAIEDADMLKICATLCRIKIAAASEIFTVVALTAMASMDPTPAEARVRHSPRHASSQSQLWSRPTPARHGHARIVHRPSTASNSTLSRLAAIVVDANSGRTLYARNEHDLRHPASITKVMTLYLLFEQLEQGRLRLDSAIRMSAHAAAQAPTKLGLRPGATISVENAIMAVVTRSANDIAVALAEAIGGDEESFAELMTRKARALGMSRTHFANASGLPNDEQVTTAYDLTVLGRAIQDHFPRHYRYFATQAFQYGGTTIRNHNHLLERVEGMDGIKTGYTRASGFNLLSSVKRDGHYIVAVVLGGASAAGRDRIMADLIEAQIDEGANVRTAAAIPEPRTDDVVAEAAPAPSSLRPRVPDAEPRPEPPLPFAPVSLRAGLTSDALRIATISAEVPAERPRPAFVSGAPKIRQGDAPPARGEILVTPAALDGSTARPGNIRGGASTATPSTMYQLVSSVAKPDAGPAKTATTKVQISRADTSEAVETKRPAAARSGWMIQIGATDDLNKANELLAKAKSQGHEALASARPFTERVQKGSETLYRARFAGLEEGTAELACRTLKRSGISCFATKN